MGGVLGARVPTYGSRLRVIRAHCCRQRYTAGTGVHPGSLRLLFVDQDNRTHHTSKLGLQRGRAHDTSLDSLNPESHAQAGSRWLNFVLIMDSLPTLFLT